jgi:hypothetical protein
MKKLCENNALKIDKILARSMEIKTAERDYARKQFAPLAKNVLRVTLSNLIIGGLALTQMTGVNCVMSSAIKCKKRISENVPPREVAMKVSRLENIKKIAPYFPWRISPIRSRFIKTSTVFLKR